MCDKCNMKDCICEESNTRVCGNNTEENSMTDVNANEIAKEVAQQIAQQVGQSVSEAISKLLQSQAQTTGTTLLSGQRSIEDIGGTERLEKDQMGDSGMLFANMKRTYDEYQQESLESIKRNRSYVDKLLSDNHGYDMNARNIATQSLQNAVETANLVSKQAVAHRDIAINAQWNVDEQGYQVVEALKAIGTDLPTLRAVIAEVLASMAKEKTA